VSVSNCDWANKSALTDLDIEAVVSSVPTVTTIVPDLLVGDSTSQMITLTGTSFVEGGSVFVYQDSAIETMWISSTEVTAIVPAALTAPGTLPYVGFVNPTSGASGACTSLNPGNCDWVNGRSNMTDIPIIAP
jgi:hypothetical protein